MSGYVVPERVQAARRMDLLTYLQCREPDDLVPAGNNVYRLRSHDSLKISNGKWCWWSRGVGGRSALDYLITVQGMDLPRAVETIEGANGMAAVQLPTPSPIQSKPFWLPERFANNRLAVRYLAQRGIQREVLRYCLENGLLFEEARYHNVVFAGFDETGTPRSASLRGTGSIKFFRDAPGSSKRYSFSIPARSECRTVHLFEGAIDLLSYASLQILAGKDWRAEYLLSQDGVAPPRKNGRVNIPLALEQFLATHADTATIVFHYDNDDPGRAAAQALAAELRDRYTVVDAPPQVGKDVNDELRQVLHQRREHTQTR